MTILVFSDTHLTHRFNKKKFFFLSRIINKADKIIINGDFWDGYLTSFNKFINSPWKKLFPILKKKKTIYIYGNHDHKKLSNEKVNLFSVKQLHSYNLLIKKNKYRITHGHIFAHSIYNFPLEKLLMFPLTKISNAIELIAQHSRIWNFFGKLINMHIYNKQKGEVKNGFFVNGHTHYPSLNINKQFANSGFVKFGIASYLLINENGILLRKESYL